MWLNLQIFGFRALWSPYYILFLVVLGVLYYLLTGPWRKKFGDFQRPTTKQYILFYTGLLLLYIVKGSPMDLLSHIMFTAHMGQMALYLLVFPILMIRGIPEWIWRKVMFAPVLGKVLHVLTKPLIAIIVFNGLFSVYHLPDILDYTKSDPISHAVISTILLFTAFCMYWRVFTPIEEMDTLSPLLKIGYIFANGVLITPACGLIIFAADPLYSTYTDTGAWANALSLCVPADVLNGLSLGGPQLFSPIPVIEDQQLGGIVMKIAQEIVFGFILAKIFFTWYKKENHGIDPLPSES